MKLQVKKIDADRDAARRYEQVVSEVLDAMSIEDVRIVVGEIEGQVRARPQVSPMRRQATDALRRARNLPVGPDRNDLRQLAYGLLRLDARQQDRARPGLKPRT